MKIGIDIRTLMDTNYSGVPEFTSNLLEEIFKLDHANEYRLFYNSAKPIRMPEFSQPNVKVIKSRFPNKILNYLLFKSFNRPRIDTLLDADVFFMPHINFIGLGRKANLLTIHDLSFLRYPRFFSVRKNFWHMMVNVKKLVSSFRHIATVSENTKKDIVELCGVRPEAVSVIYSGIPASFKVYRKDDPQLGQVREKYGLPDDFILFLGTIEPRKNISGLIEAFELLKNRGASRELKLVIAGGNGWKFGPVISAYGKSKYKDDIIFLGFVDGKDKPYLYNLAKIFVYPSFYEGFGFPPLEAMACGVPVVTSDVSSLPEITGGAGLSVNPGNVNDISLAMEKLLSDTELYSRSRDGGLEQARKFTWQNAARSYISLFSVLAEEIKSGSNAKLQE